MCSVTPPLRLASTLNALTGRSKRCTASASTKDGSAWKEKKRLQSRAASAKLNRNERSNLSVFKPSKASKLKSPVLRLQSQQGWKGMISLSTSYRNGGIRLSYTYS